MESDERIQQRRSATRKKAMGGILLTFVALGAAWFAYWFTIARYYETTDDAYAAGNLVQISPQVAGSVLAIHADNTNGVKAGQVLVRLDPADADIALAKARTGLAEAVRQFHSQTAQLQRARNMVEQRKNELTRVKGDLERRSLSMRAVSEEDRKHAHDAVAVVAASLKVAEEDYRSAQLMLMDSPLEQQPTVQRAASLLREAWLARQRCDVKSPVDGYVARRGVQVGAQVAPGAALMAVVPLQDIWVDANFKEVQISKMRIGQPVTVESDAYGSKAVYHGKVAGLAAGTGSAFSLLPPENATGNWIKVVQRLPVKIVLENKKELQDFPLRIGLSCAVQVDIRDTSGPMLMTPELTKPVFSTDALAPNMAEAEKEVARIIAINSPASVAAPAAQDPVPATR